MERKFKPVTIGTLAFCILLIGCNRANTTIGRETSARPRIEQIALSSAMEAAYGKVDFSFCANKTCYIETRALSKTDVDFITAYVVKKVLAGGGIPVLNERDAKLKLTSTLDVSGTDEVKRMIAKDVVIGQFKGTLTVVDMVNGTITKAIDLNAVSQSKRNKTADTIIL